MTSIVYFVQAGDGGNIKIGITTDVGRRMAGLQTASPVPLRLLGTIAADDDGKFHRQFAPHRVHGEWFSPHSDLLRWIETNAQAPGCQRRASRHARKQLLAGSVLETASGVIDALGGTAEVARLTKRGMQAVSNWRASGRLPPETFLILQKQLALQGCTAPPSLWSIIAPAIRSPTAAADDLCQPACSHMTISADPGSSSAPFVWGCP